MTRRQWRVQMILISVAVAVLSTMMIAVLAAKSAPGELPCVMGVELTVVVVFVLIYFKAGRAQAEEEASRKWKE